MPRADSPFPADHVGSLLHSAVLKEARGKREREAARFISLDQLCLSRSAGSPRPRKAEQWAKLRLVVEVANEVRG